MGIAIIEKLAALDRRWIFLMMLLAVAIPILLKMEFPEKPSQLARDVFDEIEQLEPGDKVLLAFDYDPSSEGELGPMATSLPNKHCREPMIQKHYWQRQTGHSFENHLSR